MIYRKVIIKLIKAYLAFSLLNVAYKCSQILAFYLKTNMLWKHIPGRTTDITGLTFMKNIKRLPDWACELSSEYPKAPLVKMAYFEPILMCNTAESVQWLLKDEFKGITKAKKTDPILQMLTKFLGEDGIFVLRHGHDFGEEDKVWEKERKTSSRIFTKTNMRNLFHETFSSKAKLVVDKLENHKGNEIDMQEIFFSFTMDSIEKFFMGSEVNSITGGMSNYAKNFDLAHFHMMSFVYNNIHVEALNRTLLPYPFGALTAFSPTMDTLFTKAVGLTNKNYKSFFKAINELDEHIYKYIKKTKKDPKLSERKDIIANFLNSNKDMPDERIRDIVLNLTIAGRDTTACAMSWMFFELAQNQDVQEKLIKEIDEKLEGRAPSLEDLDPSRMPYLNGVLFETLRLHPPVPIDTKKASRDINYIDGTVVPKGTAFLYSAYAMGRNPSVYPNPTKFNPNRWIPFKEPSLFEFPVFQAGPRFCLGKDMAKFEAKLLAATLLQKFKFSIRAEEAKNISYSLLLTMSIVNNKDKSLGKLLLIPEPRNK